MAKNYTDTRVGAQNAIRVLSAASGGNALFADTATNVLGGIASVTQLDVSGISTLNNLLVENTFKVTGFSTYVGVASFLNNAFFDSNVTIGGTLQVGDTIFGTDIDTRNLKASGIFARLSHRDGKHNFLEDIPRTLSYILDLKDTYKELERICIMLEELIIPKLKEKKY